MIDYLNKFVYIDCPSKNIYLAKIVDVEMHVTNTIKNIKVEPIGHLTKDKSMLVDDFCKERLVLWSYTNGCKFTFFDTEEDLMAHFVMNNIQG